ncbi:MAG: rod shape-determining protein MreC [Deferribacterota bacterium]|nr:rod shape-determining protein MreC [Deferribacterota bacterium]
MRIWKYVLIFVFILIPLIILQIRNPSITGPFKGIIGDILNPFVYYSHKGVNCVVNIYDSYIDLVNIKEKYKEVIEENKRLHFENIVLKEKLKTYESLKKILKIKKIYNLDGLACNVIGRSINGYISFFIIDKGKKQGISIDDPVINYDGLIGKVVEVYSNSAKVITVINPNNNVSVMNFKTRTIGIMHGDSRKRLVVDYYIKDDNVTVDDIFITSGLGKVYPKGLPVGKVVKIEIEPKSMFRKIWLESFVDFYKVENVFIIQSN